MGFFSGNYKYFLLIMVFSTCGHVKVLMILLIVLLILVLQQAYQCGSSWYN